MSRQKPFFMSLALLFVFCCGQAFAQIVPIPPQKPGSLGAVESTGSNLLRALPQILGAPSAEILPDDLPDVSDASPAEAELTAKLVENGDPIPFGVIWRIFSQVPSADGTFPMVATGRGGTWRQELRPGTYLVHAAYGKASTTALLRMGTKSVSETIILSAGGMRLQAQLSGDTPIPAAKVTFRITEQDSDTIDENLVMDGARSGLILPLNAGTYRVESQYGKTNAVVSADITVEEGKLIDATLYHEAAEVTLKLVNSPGGEAIANTKWSLTDTDQNILGETVGAFPEFVLEQGDYLVTATHEDRIYSRGFKVVAGQHRDVEVQTTP